MNYANKRRMPPPCPRYKNGPDCGCKKQPVNGDNKTLNDMTEFTRINILKAVPASMDTPATLPLRYEGPC